MSRQIDERVLYDSSVLLRRVAASLADMGVSASELSNEPEAESGRIWKERTLLVTSNQSNSSSNVASQDSEA